MWIVRLALRRPYTFVVAAILVAILTIFTCVALIPTDIFPNINIPVISVVFQYTGMAPEDMDQRIITPYERILTTTVNDIDHIESQCLNGVSVVKIYFQKNAKIESATAQVTAVSQTAIRQMPPGTQPPLVIQYNASNVPIMQLALGGRIAEQGLFDQAVNFLRPQLVTVPGAQIPYPYGGKQRQVMVDLDPEKLYAWGISSADVSAAVNAQNLILPAGVIKMGKQENEVKLNSSPDTIKELNELPIKTVKGTTVYVKDVSNVRDGFQVQTNVVHTDGGTHGRQMKRGALLSILKSGKASTLDVVHDVRDALPGIAPSLDKNLTVTPLLDQSVFVRASVEGVVKEAAIAAGLTGLMILLFLGSWRSTLIVVISIPLSIGVSIIILAALGETLNVMTLGGMALAVGILVDDATVEIENIHRNLHQRKRLVQAILDGAQQIAIPAFVSTLAICIVFVPVAFISGAAKFLFTPLAMSVVFAMLTSYLLSRTLVPTMVHYLLANEVERYGGQLDESDPHVHKKTAQHAHGDPADHAEPPAAGGKPALDYGHDEPAGFGAGMRRALGKTWVRVVLMVAAAFVVGAVVAGSDKKLGQKIPWLHTPLVETGHWLGMHWILLLKIFLYAVCAGVVLWFINRYDLIWRTHYAFNRQFEKLRRAYGALLAWALEHRFIVLGAFTTLVACAACLVPFIGNDFFPHVDAGQIRLHVRTPPGTRIEVSEQYFGRVEELILKDIPSDQIETMLDNIGIPNSGINLSLSDGSLMSPADGEILISLKEGHGPTDEYIEKLRKDLRKKFPDLTFFFSPPDIVTQVLNFGLAAPIDIQITGPQKNVEENFKIAQQMVDAVSDIPGAVDARVQQVPHTPDLRVNVDRTLASEIGVDQRLVANDMLVSLASSNQTAPNYWVNPENGVNYSILVQTPQYKVDSMNQLENQPIVPNGNGRINPAETQLLGNLSTIKRGISPTDITHYNIKPSFDVLLGVQGADLGSVSDGVRRVIEKFEPRLPSGSNIMLRGQVQSMHDSYTGLGLGMIFAVLLVYLLMVVNFQSWIDPLIILMALPGAGVGIMVMLWATQTTLSVPALMGAIMSIGVATANSILMITFANDQRAHGMNAHDAALSAGMTRLRPVMMTALAMIIGMLPMSLGLGEGGEQNAPLGRAVIGGLSMATFATLFFVPIVYSTLRRKAPVTQVEEELKE